MEYVLEAKGVRKTYPGFVLKDVTLRVPKGYIMGLIGPNGAGKTTLIKLIMNLTHKDAGQITLFGLDHCAREARVKSRVGFVYESPAYYDYLSLGAYRSIVASFYPTWDESCFRQLVGEFDLPLGQRIKRLSRGMKMKYSLALALSHAADLIIMDEPTSGLDPVFRRTLLEKLSELLQDAGKSILFSTHITSDLEHIADFITFISNGEIAFSQAKDDILENWAIVKGGNDLLTQDAKGLFHGYRRGRFGFEALTSDLGQARKRFAQSNVVIEKASLEDIMYHLVEGKQDD